MVARPLGVTLTAPRRLSRRRPQHRRDALAGHLLQSQARLSEVRDSVTNLGIQFDVRATKIEATVKAVAVGSARLELWGLVLIGLGTLVAALPTLVGWS